MEVVFMSGKEVVVYNTRFGDCNLIKDITDDKDI